MSVQIIDSDFSDWDTKKLCPQECQFNGHKICILNENSMTSFLPLETRIKDGFNFSPKKQIEPKMSRISDASLEYRHTNSDGSGDSVIARIKLLPPKDSEQKSESTDKTESTTYEIDSHDRENPSNENSSEK